MLLMFLLMRMISATAQQSLTWFKTFSGKIDKYPVTMLLYRSGHAYEGYYYYNNVQQLISLRGSDTTSRDSIHLEAYGGQSYEQFTLAIDSDRLNGSWQKISGAWPKKFEALEVKGPLSFNYISTKGMQKARPALPGSPEATYQAAAVWPSGESPQAIAVKKTLVKLFTGADTATRDIGILLENDRKKILANYHKDILDATNAEISASPGLYSVVIQNILKVCYASSEVLSLAYQNYTYTGGAHGNYGTSYAAVDLRTNRQLTLEDVVDTKSSTKLGKLIEKKFRLQYQLKPTDSLQVAGLFDDEIKPTNNFYVTGKGIGFSYTPYEIGPYSLGQVDIFVLFTDLRATGICKVQ